MLSKPVKIRAFKHNKLVYRSYEKCEIIMINDKYICVDCQYCYVQHRKFVEKYHRIANLKSVINFPVLWFFPKNKWFNILVKKKKIKSQRFTLILQTPLFTKIIILTTPTMILIMKLKKILVVMIILLKNWIWMNILKMLKSLNMMMH